MIDPEGREESVVRLLEAVVGNRPRPWRAEPSGSGTLWHVRDASGGLVAKSIDEPTADLLVGLVDLYTEELFDAGW